MQLGSNGAVDLLASQVTIPLHVVRRDFAAETVVLNLKTGKYHGLNPTAGNMLKELEGAETVAAAAKRLSDEYGRPLTEIRDDLVQLCRHMLERDLIEISSPSG